MSVATRSLGVLVAAAALVAGSMSAANALVSQGSSSGVSTVDSCSQNLAVGQMACFSMRRTDVKWHSRQDFKPHATNPALTPSGFGPTTLQSAYNLPSATNGTGQRVYIVDAYDDPNAEADLGVYRTQYGLPACTTANGCFQKLNQNGQTSPMPSPNSGWAGEESLDIDMASAICPNCGITLIESNDNGTNLYVAVKEAATLGAKFVSMSWGGSEGSSQTSLDSAYFQSSGVVYTVSTGDSAYSGGVEYPASSNRVVAVGGTRLVSAANSRGWSETAWKTSSSEGAGSGCSAYDSKPSWQSIISTTVCSRRATADVSAVADPGTGVAVYQTYGGSGWTVYGGTSVAAPIIASTYALAGPLPAGTQAAPGLYANTSSLYDVTSGNTGSCSPAVLCTSGPGWDGPTGLGTPNGLVAFGGAGGGGGGGGGNTVTVTNPGSQTGTVGTAASLQISASDSASASLTYSASGLPAGLSINASTGLISGTPSASGTSSVTVTATDTTSAHGSATFSWTVNPVAGSCANVGSQLFTNPGFESGSTGWSATSGVINTDGAHSRTGSGYSWLDGYGTTHTDTLSRSVTIPANCHATLTYYLWISSRDTGSTVHDTLKLTAGTSTVQSFSNLNRGTGYVQRSVDLSSFAGQTITVKWTGVENSSVATSWFIDDTALTLS